MDVNLGVPKTQIKSLIMNIYVHKLSQIGQLRGVVSFSIDIKLVYYDCMQRNLSSRDVFSERCPIGLMLRNL